jgi:hypothetical protein
LAPIGTGYLPVFSELLNAGCVDIEMPPDHYVSIKREGCYERCGRTVHPGEHFRLELWGPMEVFIDEADADHARIAVLPPASRSTPIGCCGFQAAARSSFRLRTAAVCLRRRSSPRRCSEFWTASWCLLCSSSATTTACSPPSWKSPELSAPDPLIGGGACSTDEGSITSIFWAAFGATLVW